MAAERHDATQPAHNAALKEAAEAKGAAAADAYTEYGTSAQPHRVMTVIYRDENMRLAQPASRHQENDWHGRCPGALVGEMIDNPLNPVLWPSR